MIEKPPPYPRSCSVARPIMKDSHSFDSGSNPDGSIYLSYIALLTVDSQSFDYLIQLLLPSMLIWALRLSEAPLAAGKRGR